MPKTRPNRPWPFILILAAGGALLRADDGVHLARLPDGTRYGWLGEKPSQPAPTVFILGGSVEEELGAPPHTRGLDVLRKAGILCANLDLPGHGADQRPGEPKSIRAWRYRLDRGEDVTGEFARHASEVLTRLISDRSTDPAKVAVFGTSRGGFMALHFAAADARVRQIACFAPVTDLQVMKEFEDPTQDTPAFSRSALRLVDKLHDRGFWIIIGNSDHRVETQCTIRFFTALLDSARAHGLAAPRIELHVEPAIGHTVPDGCYQTAAHWLLLQWGFPTR